MWVAQIRFRCACAHEQDRTSPSFLKELWTHKKKLNNKETKMLWNMEITYNKWPRTRFSNQNNNIKSFLFSSVYKSNLSGDLTSLEDLRRGASGVGHLNCGVLAGASEASAVFSGGHVRCWACCCRLHMRVLVVHHRGCFGYKCSLLWVEYDCGFA